MAEKLSIGIVGSRWGMNVAQGLALDALFARYTPARVVHHDRHGAGCQAHYKALACKIPTLVFPVDPPHERAFVRDATRTYRPIPWDAALRAVVDSSDLLVTIPCSETQAHDELWIAVDYAREAGVPVVVVEPDGTTRRG